MPGFGCINYSVPDHNDSGGPCQGLASVRGILVLVVTRDWWEQRA